MDLNFWQVIFLALLQGVTELFPISSLGHTVIIPGLLGWGNLVKNTACSGENCFLPIIVALHLGTALALLIYYWRVWLQVLKSLVSIAQKREIRKGTEDWVSWLIILGTVPAGLIGVVFQKKLEALFASPIIAATFLIINGSILFLGEAMRRRSEESLGKLSPEEREAHFRPLSALSWKEALLVGLAQSLALIPGISRSGTTIVAGLGVRMTHFDAARFSFLLGTPVILGAAVLEIPKLLHQPTSVLLMIVAGMVIAGVAAFLSTMFLERYFAKGRLDPFAYYCWAVGLLSLGILLFVLRAPA
jgi:undecaprenyl-diphosphatase